MAALARRAGAPAGRTRMPPRRARSVWPSVRAPPPSPQPARPAPIRSERSPRPGRLRISPRPTRSPLPLERGSPRPLRASAPPPHRRRARPRPVRPPLGPATRHGEPARPPGAGWPSLARPHPVMWTRSKARSRSAANRCPRLDCGVGVSVAPRARSAVGGAGRPSSADRRSRPGDPAAAMPAREEY